MARQPQTVRVVRFGVFEADLQARELRKSGLKIKIHDQPFQVLTVLLEHPGEIVSRDELHKRIWPADTFVDFDHGLNTAVNKLRDALGDSADSPRFIETVPRRGYRFLGPLESVSHTAAVQQRTEPALLSSAGLFAFGLAQSNYQQSVLDPGIERDRGPGVDGRHVQAQQRTRCGFASRAVTATRVKNILLTEAERAGIRKNFPASSVEATPYFAMTLSTRTVVTASSAELRIYRSPGAAEAVCGRFRAE